MPDATVVEVRCPGCGHFVLETSRTEGGTSRVQCRGCHRFVKIEIKDGQITTTIDVKKK